jgi:hypothetical protein
MTTPREDWRGADDGPYRTNPESGSQEISMSTDPTFGDPGHTVIKAFLDARNRRL